MAKWKDDETSADVAFGAYGNETPTVDLFVREAVQAGVVCVWTVYCLTIDRIIMRGSIFRQKVVSMMM